MTNVIHVTCAIIERNGKILVAQRSREAKLPLKWEFPGGKIEDGENEEQSLIREIQEELGVLISVNKRLAPALHHYHDFSILLIPFLCTLQKGEPMPTVHKQVEWAERSQLPFYNWAEADIPIMNQLLED